MQIGMNRTKFFSFTAALTAFALNACSVSDALTDEAAIGERVAPIMNGVEESGFPAVGELIQYDWEANENNGPICSSVLVRPNVVLTAAHCLVYGFDPEKMAFLVGEEAVSGVAPDADPPYAVPEGASLYAVERYVSYPTYSNDALGGSDIAVVFLKESVPDVTPIPLFAGDLHAYIGQTTKSVGYGYVSLAEIDVNTRKRSTDLKIIDAFDGEYYVQGENTGICKGDSGGANLIDVNGEWQLAGIHESLLTGRITSEADLMQGCLRPSGITSVEALRSWIYQQIGEAGDCRQDADLCHCAEACQADGLCEIHRCSGSKTCYDYLSIPGNDAAAAIEIWTTMMNMSPESAGLYNRYVACAKEFDEGDDRWFETCKADYFACVKDGFDVGTGDLSCREVIGCIDNCDPRNASCGNRCLDDARGTEEALAYNLYVCANYYDCALDLEGDCIATHCQAELDACGGPDEDEDASLSGGDSGLEDAEIDAETDATDPGDAETDVADADFETDGHSEDASDMDVSSDASLADGTTDASNDAHTTANDSSVSADTNHEETESPSDHDAGTGAEDDEDKDDGCSALPGAHGCSGIAFLGLPFFCRGRRRRTRF